MLLIQGPQCGYMKRIQDIGLTDAARSGSTVWPILLVQDLSMANAAHSGPSVWPMPTQRCANSLVVILGSRTNSV